MGELDRWQGVEPYRRTWAIVCGPLPPGLGCYLVRLPAAPYKELSGRVASGSGNTLAEATAQALRLWAENYGKDW